jgi:WbqC-like protein family
VRVAIHQPQYFPWPAYVHKVLSADIFVYLDSVQFSKNGVQNRNQIKTAQGALWLTIPVRNHLGQLLKDTRVAEPGATRKHWKTIKTSYARTRGFARWQSELEALLDRDTDFLLEAAIDSTEWMLSKLNVRTERIKASEIDGVSGESSELIASICGALRATSYLTGTGALAYLDERDFAEIGCEVMVQQWKPLIYEQVNGDFVPDLSTLDLLLNTPDEALNLIEAAGSWNRFNR